MDYLSSPIDLVTFNRLFRRARGFTADTLLIGFKQTERNWTIIYQDDDMILSFSGRTSVTRAWIVDTLAEEAV